MARGGDAGGGKPVKAGRAKQPKLKSGGDPARPASAKARTSADTRVNARTSERTSRRTGAPAPAGADAFFVEPDRAQAFGRLLRAWYRRHARDLPWRRTRDPYHILVSELMLQQTQVSRVVDYYARFLERFPTLRHVAEAAPDEVTAQWEGLGYYARARNLHALARRVHEGEGPGTLPSTPEALRALPGIGAYTAGAVASFAFERRAALVDTNVARVLSRVFAPELDPKRPRDLTRLWRIAESVLPRTGRAAWTHNQALMELGALVCTARRRHCGRCPVRPQCATHALRGCDEARPARRSGTRGADGAAGRAARPIRPARER
jgi:A/G-specific adenine glycosylase